MRQLSPEERRRWQSTTLAGTFGQIGCDESVHQEISSPA